MITSLLLVFCCCARLCSTLRQYCMPIWIIRLTAVHTYTALVVLRLCLDVTLYIRLTDDSRTVNQLDDFMECLSKFTRYNSVRPLATLSYASDLYNGSSIVSR